MSIRCENQEWEEMQPAEFTQERRFAHLFMRKKLQSSSSGQIGHPAAASTLTKSLFDFWLQFLLFPQNSAQLKTVQTWASQRGCRRKILNLDRSRFKGPHTAKLKSNTVQFQFECRYRPVDGDSELWYEKAKTNKQKKTNKQRSLAHI